MSVAAATLKTFHIPGVGTGRFHDLQALETLGIGSVKRLPVSIRLVLESLVRNCDGVRVEEHHVRELANWQPQGKRTEEIPFVVARVVLQDFTGVPLLCDLAAMRSTAAEMGKNPKAIEPLVPVDLVVDHSVQVDHYGTPDALRKNMELEFARNRERYQFMKWGMQAFDTFRVIPPGIGIIHQVNLEYLFRGVRRQETPEGPVYYPDTLVGTDSHTTMINAVGVVGWGVGGIEAEAAMLGQPIYFLTPDVVGVELVGSLPEGVTATDLVLTITEMLRKAKVVGQFVEFFGEGAASLSVPDRATIANMAPEYGATMGFFPVDEKTVEYLRATGRTEEEIAAFEAYFRAQSLFGMPRAGEIDYTRTLKLDLSTVRASLAGPKRPQDRIELQAMKSNFETLFSKPVSENGFGKSAEELGKRYPVPGREGLTLGHGDVLIAAITSCTNTSNPAVLIAAGLLAKKAVEKGLSVSPHIKTSLAPGSRVVTEYLQKAGLLDPLAQLGFALPATGALTCIGNAGDLAPSSTRRSTENDLVVAAVLSGNRNFEARIHPNIRANYLASPPLGGGLRHRRTGERRSHERAAGHGRRRQAGLSARHLAEQRGDPRRPALRQRSRSLPAPLPRFHQGSRPVECHPGAHGRGLQLAEVDLYRPAALLRRFLHAAAGGAADHGCQGLAAAGRLGHHRPHLPRGFHSRNSPAGQWLKAHGVERKDFNSYGARRGNHEVMVRGTFANVRLKNLMLPPKPDGSRIEGGYTLLDGKQTTVYEAAMAYRERGIPTVVFAGEEYGTGSSRAGRPKGRCSWASGR